MRWLSLLATILALPAFAREGPDNLIYVSAVTHTGLSSGMYPCTAAGVPYPCCVDAGLTPSCANVLNGADICVALEAAEDAPNDGKLERVILPEGVITEAEHRIYGTPYWGSGNGAPCGGNFGDEGGFPDGLIVQGKGIGKTILKATTTGNTWQGARGVFGQTDSQSIVMVAAGGGLSKDEIPMVIYQDMTLDGEREFQPTVVTAQYAFYGFPKASGGDTVAMQMLKHLEVRRVRMEDTTRMLMGLGSVTTPGATPPADRLNGVVRILGNEFSGGGCHQGYPNAAGGGQGTGSPGMLPCGQSRTDSEKDKWNGAAFCLPADCPTNYNGIGSICTPVSPTNPSSCPGWVNQGANIDISVVSNTVIDSNSFDLGLHFGIGATFAVPEGVVPGTGNCAEYAPTAYDDFGPGYCGTGWTIRNNRFRRMGAGGIDNHGAYFTRLIDNHFESITCMDTNWSVQNWCNAHTFASTWTRWFHFKGNTYAGTTAPTQQINTWNPQPGETFFKGYESWPEKLIEDEVYELDCSLLPTMPYGTPPANLVAQIGWPLRIWAASVNVNAGTYAHDLSNIRLKNLTFKNDVAGNNCIGSLSAQPFVAPGGANSGKLHDLTIEGGTYIVGGQDAFPDGSGVPGTPTSNPSIAYFNYVSNLKVIGAPTFDGKTVNGKVTFGRTSGFADDMQGGCYENTVGDPDKIVLTNTATVNNRAGIASACP